MTGDVLSRIPKIDLHAHLEGSLPERTISHLASRHRLPEPNLRRFDGFAGFLKAFGAVCDLLVDEADFERAANDLFADARKLGVIHLEVLFSPQVHLRRGVPLISIMRGLSRARGRAMRSPGFSIVYIADGVRQWGGPWFDEVVGALGPWAGRGLAGIGVGGDEGSHPAREFAASFRRARSMGLHTTIHAGESAGPESIRDAIEHLPVDRIGHGFRAAGDPDLMALIRRRGITLEICPTSNLATGLVPSLTEHPVRALFDAGLRVTINTDDGAFFGTDIEKELRAASQTAGFTHHELRQLLLNSAGAAFTTKSRRRALARRIRRGWEPSRADG